MKNYKRWRMVFDHDTFTGSTAANVLRQLADAQWHEMDKRGIKEALTWRAYCMDDVYLDSSRRFDQFLIDVASTSLCDVLVQEQGSDKWITPVAGERSGPKGS